MMVRMMQEVGGEPGTGTLVLRCVDCGGGVVSGGESWACLCCGWTPTAVDSYVDFLAHHEDMPAAIQDDYVWDYRKDPRISALTIERWRQLTDLHVGVITALGQPDVVSIGGGGENWVSRQLDRRVRSYVVVDTSREQLTDMRLPIGAEGLAVRAPAERLPLPDRSVDVVEMSGVLDHLFDVPAALREARRVVRPGGIVSVAMTNDGSWYRRLGRRMGFQTDDSHVHSGHFDVQGVQRLLEDAGFETRELLTIAFLRLPVRVENLVGGLLGHRRAAVVLRATDALFRRALGTTRGGMMLVVGRPVPGAARAE